MKPAGNTNKTLPVPRLIDNEGGVNTYLEDLASLYDAKAEILGRHTDVQDAAQAYHDDAKRVRALKDFNRKEH